MKTKKPIAAQILGDYQTDNDGTSRLCLLCGRKSFKKFRKWCSEMTYFKVKDDTLDYRFIAAKPNKLGGRFWDITITGEIHGLVQALNEAEARRIVERMRMPRFAILEPEDEILSAVMTEIEVVKIGYLTYSHTYNEWVFSNTLYEMADSGIEFRNPNDKDKIGTPYMMVYCPAGYREIF